MPVFSERSFGELLKRYRIQADLTQEALAERARVSARAISDLERGVKHAPRQDTLARLLQVLSLAASDCVQLEAAAQRQRRRIVALRPQHDPGPLPPLVGRAHEL